MSNHPRVRLTSMTSSTASEVPGLDMGLGFGDMGYEHSLPRGLASPIGLHGVSHGGLSGAASGPVPGAAAPGSSAMSSTHTHTHAHAHAHANALPSSTVGPAAVVASATARLRGSGSATPVGGAGDNTTGNGSDNSNTNSNSNTNTNSNSNSNSNTNSNSNGNGSGCIDGGGFGDARSAALLLQKGPFALECARVCVTGGAFLYGRVHLRSARGFLAQQVTLRVYDNISAATGRGDKGAQEAASSDKAGYIYHEVVLYSSGHPEREIAIAPGIYSFSFRVAFPRNIPPTFHHPGHGKDTQFRALARCTYTVEATMTRLDGSVVHSSSASVICVGDFLDSNNLALKVSPNLVFNKESNGPFDVEAIIKSGAGFQWDGNTDYGLCCRVADEIPVHFQIRNIPWDSIALQQEQPSQQQQQQQQQQSQQQNPEANRITLTVSLERTICIEPPQGSTREKCTVTETINSKETVIQLTSKEECINRDIVFFIGDAVIKSKKDIESETLNSHIFTPSVTQNSTFRVSYNLVAVAQFQGKASRATFPVTIFQSEHYRSQVDLFPQGRIHGWIYKASKAPMIKSDRWRWRWCVIDDYDFFTWYDMNYVGTDQFEFKKRKSVDVMKCYFQNLETSSAEKKMYCWRFFPGRRSDRLRIYRLSSPSDEEHSKWCTYFNERAFVVDLSRFAPPGVVAGEVLKLSMKALWNRWENRWCSIDSKGIFRYFVINSPNEPIDGMYDIQTTFQLKGEFDLSDCRFQTMNTAEFAGLKTKLPSHAQEWKGFFKILPYHPKKMKSGAAKEYYFAVATADDAYTWVSSFKKE